MRLGGQRVVVVPVQRVEGLNVDAERATRELLFALAERDARTRWITPDALRRALARAPDFAPDPANLPADPFVQNGDRVTTEPLAGILRRYTALMDARLALVPRAAVWVAPGGGTGRVRFDAVVVDTRSGAVVWFGQADGEPAPAPEVPAVASAAAALAARMIASGEAPQ